MNDAISRAFAALVGSRPGLALATADAAGKPTATYVPFAVHAGAFAFVASGLAAHAANLATRPAISLLIAANAATDPYACARATVDGLARRVPPGAEADAIWDALAARHGDTVAVLRSLPDFTAFACAPDRVRLVLGFAAAHELDRDAARAALRDSLES